MGLLMCALFPLQMVGRGKGRGRKHKKKWKVSKTKASIRKKLRGHQRERLTESVIWIQLSTSKENNEVLLFLLYWNE